MSDKCTAKRQNVSEAGHDRRVNSRRILQHKSYVGEKKGDDRGKLSWKRADPSDGAAASLEWAEGSTVEALDGGVRHARAGFAGVAKR